MALNTNMKKLLFIIPSILLLASCSYEKGAVPTPDPNCSNDTVKYLRVVDMQDNFFSPMELTLLEGDTVKFKLVGANPHSATCDGTSGSSLPSGANSFDTGVLLTTGDESKKVISTPGTYNYVCIVHGSSMMGTLIVKKRCQ